MKGEVHFRWTDKMVRIVRAEIRSVSQGWSEVAMRQNPVRGYDSIKVELAGHETVEVEELGAGYDLEVVFADLTEPDVGICVMPDGRSMPAAVVWTFDPAEKKWFRRVVPS